MPLLFLLLLVPSAARAQYGFTFDLRVHDNGGKEATVTDPGDALTLDLFVTARGNDTNPNNDAMSDVFSRFFSSSAGLLGDLVGLPPPAPFNQISSTPGAKLDVDGDGDLDIGTSSLTGDVTTLYFSRAGTSSIPTGSNGILVGHIRFTATQLSASEATVSWALPLIGGVYPILGRLDGAATFIQSPTDPRSRWRTRDNSCRPGDSKARLLSTSTVWCRPILTLARRRSARVRVARLSLRMAST